MTRLLCVVIILSSSLSHAKTIEKIVAIVNSSIITHSDLKIYKTKLDSDGLVDNTLFEFTDIAKVKKNRQSLLDHLINEKLLDSRSKKLGIAITIEMVEQEIRRTTKNRRISRAQLKQVLKNQGISFSDYQEFVRLGLERKSMISKEVSSKIKISDDDIASFYTKNSKDASSLIFEYKLAHILFLPSNGGAKSAQKKAKEVLNKLKSGSDFIKLAAQHSEDPSFTHGGGLGSFKKGEMVPPIEKAVATLKEGEHSRVVKTRAGYHIIKVLKKTLVPDPNLEAQKPKIRSILFSKALRVSFTSWLKKLRKDAYIHIN